MADITLNKVQVKDLFRLVAEALCDPAKDKMLDALDARKLQNTLLGVRNMALAMKLELNEATATINPSLSGMFGKDAIQAAADRGMAGIQPKK